MRFNFWMRRSSMRRRWRPNCSHRHNRKATIISSWPLPAGSALRFQVWARSSEVKWCWVGSSQVKWGWVRLHDSYSSSRCGLKDDPLMAEEAIKWRLLLINAVWFHITGPDEKPFSSERHSPSKTHKAKYKCHMETAAFEKKKRERILNAWRTLLALSSGSFNRRWNLEICDQSGHGEHFVSLQWHDAGLHWWHDQQPPRQRGGWGGDFFSLYHTAKDIKGTIWQ